MVACVFLEGVVTSNKHNHICKSLQWWGSPLHAPHIHLLCRDSRPLFIITRNTKCRLQSCHMPVGTSWLIIECGRIIPILPPPKQKNVKYNITLYQYKRIVFDKKNVTCNHVSGWNFFGRWLGSGIEVETCPITPKCLVTFSCEEWEEEKCEETRE